MENREDFFSSLQLVTKNRPVVANTANDTRSSKNITIHKLSCLSYKNVNKIRGDLLNKVTFLNSLLLRKMPLSYSCNKSTQDV